MERKKVTDGQHCGPGDTPIVQTQAVQQQKDKPFHFPLLP